MAILAVGNPFNPPAENLTPADRLQNHHLQKDRKDRGPLQNLLMGAYLIAGVATSIFSGLAGLSAFLVGVGVFVMLQAITNAVMNQFPTIHQKAAEALNSPGFYEAASGDLNRNLSSAEAIVIAHDRWIAGEIVAAAVPRNPANV